MATMIYILFLYNIMPIFGAYYNKKQNAVRAAENIIHIFS